MLNIGGGMGLTRFFIFFVPTESVHPGQGIRQSFEHLENKHVTYYFISFTINSSTYEGICYMHCNREFTIL